MGSAGENWPIEGDIQEGSVHRRSRPERRHVAGGIRAVDVGCPNRVGLRDRHVFPRHEPPTTGPGRPPIVVGIADDDLETLRGD